jgi:glycerol kinase
MEADSGVTTTELRVDGGAALNDWLMQFQADVLDLPVRRPAQVETTALGAAGLAGVAEGVWSDGHDFVAAQPEGQRFEPEMGSEAREALLDGWARAVRATVAWAREATG